MLCSHHFAPQYFEKSHRAFWLAYFLMRILLPFSLATYKIFSFSLVFNHLIMICPYGFLKISNLPMILRVTESAL